MGPGAADRPVDHIYTEHDWAGGSYESLAQRYTATNRRGEVFENWNIARSAYAKGKLDAEKFAYQFGEKTGIDVVSVCPCHVLGPLMGAAHNSLWQQRIGQFMEGGNGGFSGQGQDWNIIDVRDIAETQRLLATSAVATNGSRYLMVAQDESGEPPTRELLDTLAQLFPNIDVARDFQPPASDTRLRARCTKAVTELGLSPHAVNDTLRDTVNSLLDLGIVTPLLKNR
jgi:nucleoside-diphosphate-sugar epimerase